MSRVYLPWICMLSLTACDDASSTIEDAASLDMAADAAPSDAAMSDVGLDAQISQDAAPDRAVDMAVDALDCPDPAAILADYYAIHPREQLNAQMQLSFETVIEVEAAVCRGEFVDADARLAALWTQYPVGTPVWNAAQNPGNGINLGRPVGYYAARMLQTIVDHGLSDAAPPVRTVRLGVALPGCSEGIEPRTAEERASGEGVRVRHTLEPSLFENDHAIIRESFDLFNRYVFAATRGRLQVELDFHALPDVCVPVSVSRSGLSLASIDSSAAVFEALPRATRSAIDWWIVIYPSHVPEQYPDFAGQTFISGGMGLAPNGGPLFLGDDRWFVRKPPHLGDGPYTTAERRVYLPQWLQHEFFHHLFRAFPEHALEAESHQWFDRQTWPPDFEGVYEPDYYAESLTKRIWQSDPPLHVRLRYATDGVDWSGIERADVLGTYVRMPEENPWHRGTISDDGPNLRWTNTADVSWALGDALSEGRLTGGEDNPYFGRQDIDFYLEFSRDALGDFVPPIRGFRFNGQLYQRIE